MMSRGACVVVVLLASACPASAPSRVKAADEARAGSTAADVAQEVDVAGYHVLETVQRGAAADAPVIVALHGRGGDPRNMTSLFHEVAQPVLVASVKAPLPFHVRTQWFEWAPGTSEAQLGKNVDDAAKAVWPAIEQIARGRKKLVVTGFSQGAMLAYALACQHPNEIALAVPISGRTTASIGSSCAPIVALHGDADDVIDISYDRESVAALQKNAGARVELREFHGVRHELTADVRRALLDAVASVL